MEFNAHGTRLISINNRFVNLYLLIDEGKPDVTLIDTGLAGSGPKLVLKTLAELGKTPTNLTRILITHADPDHTGGAAELKRLTGAALCASAIEAEAMPRGASSREAKGNGLMRAVFSIVNKMMPMPPVGADQILSDGDVLPVAGGLQVLSTPGHTPGHLSFYAPAQGWLIAGDSLNATRGVLKFLDAPVTWDFAVGMDSLRKEAALKPKVVACGHGPMLENPVFPV